MNRPDAEAVDNNAFTHPHEIRFRGNTLGDLTCLLKQEIHDSNGGQGDIRSASVCAAACICFLSQPQNHSWTEVTTPGRIKKGKGQMMLTGRSGNM